MAGVSKASTEYASTAKPAPQSILIVGAGVFGLSTFSHLLTLPRYARTSITLLDTHLPSLEGPTDDLPTQNPYAASIDSSRIVRPDYAKPAYARLALAAQKKWRLGYGDRDGDGVSHPRNDGIIGESRGPSEQDPVYRESGLVIAGNGSGSEYVREAKKNAEDLGLNVRGLNRPDDFIAVIEGQEGLTRKMKRSRTDIEGWIEGSAEGRLSGETEAHDVTADSDAARAKRNRDRAAALGEIGYINYSSGWVDNGRAMANVMARSVTIAQERNRQPDKGRITFIRGKAAHLLFSEDTKTSSKVTGVALADDDDDHHVKADLIILATGAHTPSLVNLQGHAEARGQAMAYITLTPSEAHALRDTPVLLNMTTGLFVIPPVLVSLPQPPQSLPQPEPHPSNTKTHTNNDSSSFSTSLSSPSTSTKTHLLKIAQHAYGYANPTPITLTTGVNTTHTTTASVPSPLYTSIPPTSALTLRTFLSTLYPPSSSSFSFSTRPFHSTRLCWYTDTPTGDFLITYHPHFQNLFLATGGSGHGFKFLPVLGEKIVEGVEGRLGGELRGLWRWRGERDGDGDGDGEGGKVFRGTEDGSRGGEEGEVLGGEWIVDTAIANAGAGAGGGAAAVGVGATAGGGGEKAYKAKL